MKKLKATHVPVSPGLLLIAAMIASGSILCHGAVPGWTGDYSTQSSGWNNVAVPGGSSETVITTAGASANGGPLSANLATTPANVASTVDVTSGLLTGTQGSGFSTVFHQSAVGNVTFNWNFLTSGAPAEGDYAFYTLHPLGTPASTITVLATTASSLTSPNNTQLYPVWTGFNAVSVPNVAVGDWVLGFGVMDVSNSFADSALAIANVTPVPEPWQWSLISALALGGLAVARRMRVSRA
jgi:hypothetical protein